MTECVDMEGKKRGRPPAANPKDGRLEVRMEPEVLVRLKAEAERRGISTGELVRRLIIAAVGD